MGYLENLWNALDFGSLRDMVLRLVSVFLCLTVHETCHGLAALALGDPTAKRARRLSLNPLRHIDWLGRIMMVVAGFGWAKPVPVDPRYFKKPKQGMAITALAGPVSNFLLALVFSLYLLAQKETLLAQSRRLLRRMLPQKAADRLMHLLSLANNAFSSFVTGQVTEAFILGTLCCIGMLILRLPYALPVSVIIASLSLIPIFGAWIGAATGAFLIVFQSPIKALTFLIFLLILQQVEGNLIYPRVVGKSVGLPGLWVLAAVTVGGGAFGVLGMLLGVPVCSVVYALVQDFIRSDKPVGTPPEE